MYEKNKDLLIASLSGTGQFAPKPGSFIIAITELQQLANTNEQRNDGKYGEWYGDKLVQQEADQQQHNFHSKDEARCFFMIQSQAEE